MKRLVLLGLAGLAVLAPWGAGTSAVEPPSLVNYQGVLRNSVDQPLDGPYDMEFWFWRHATSTIPADCVTIDRHTAAQGGQVDVDRGLFNVLLGGGVVTDCNNVAAEFGAMFRNFSDLWMEVRIDGEVASSRVKLLSAGYATNAGSLEGMRSAQFLRSDMTTSFGPGTLTVSPGATLHVEGRVDVKDDIHMGDMLALGNDQHIYFSDPTGTDAHSLTWKAIQRRFEFSAPITTTGTLRAGSAVSAAYNHIGSGGSPVSGDITASSDLYVDSDLEVREQVHARGSVVVGDSTPAANQAFSSFGEAGGSDETTIITGPSDVYVGGDLEVDGLINVSSTVHGGPGSILRVESDADLFFMFDDDNSSATSVAEWYKDGSYVNTNLLMQLESDGDVDLRGDLREFQSFDLAESFLKREAVEPGDVVRVDPDLGRAVRLASDADGSAVIGVVSEKPGVLFGGPPFDAESLAAVWGEEVHSRFLAEASSLRDEVLARHPELRTQPEALSPRESGPTAAPGDAQPANSALGREPEILEARIEQESLDLFFEQHFAPVALAGRVPVKVDARHGPIGIGDLLAPSPTPGMAMKATKAGPVIGTALEAFASGTGRVLTLVHRSFYIPPEGEGIRETPSDRGEAVAIRVPDPNPATDPELQPLPGSLQIVPGGGAYGQSSFSVFREGEGSVAAEVFRVDEDGNVFSRGSLRPNSMDVAEYFPISESVEAGDVVAADRDRVGRVRKATAAKDPAVVGIVSSRAGVLLGGGISGLLDEDAEVATCLEEARQRGDRDEEHRLWSDLEQKFLQTHAPVALAGTVQCKVDARYGAIRVGDLLTTSPTPGHAMVAADPTPGTIVGKALEPFAEGTGAIRIIVMLR